MVVTRGSISGFVVILLLALTWHVNNASAANILGLFTSMSPSHVIVHMSVVKALAEKGHNVTVVSSLKPKVTHNNITHIVIPPDPEKEQRLNHMMSDMLEQENNMWNLMKVMLSSMTLMMDIEFETLKNKRFTRLYEQTDTKFDLFILGYAFSDFQLGVAAKLNIPIIMDFSGNPSDFTNFYVGNPSESSYVPNMYISVEPGKTMTFAQRMQNVIGGVMFKIMGYLLERQWENYYYKLFPRENFPSYKQMQRNVSLLFCNSHFSEGLIRPNVPAQIEIGGIQVKEKPDPLNSNIVDHLNAATKHGAVLFCLGSNVKSSFIKPETIAIIFKVLSELKQNVIWKWDDFDNLPGKSPNILYIKWLPQDDILAHPNLKLFITHAGKGGIAEAQYHGVPMVALPIFADQTGNAHRMVLSGFGLEINMRQLTEADFKYAVNEVLTNSTYRQNVQKFSQLYRDRPMTAKQSVVYWTEYVLRHHGAAHMQSPLTHMNLIQELNLDVLGFIGGVLLVIVIILKYFFKFCYSKLFRKSVEPKKSSKKYKSQ